MNTKKYTGIILAAIMVCAVFAAAMPAIVSAADPVGPETATFENESRYEPSTSPSGHLAKGGNITSVAITTTTLTGKWQGYYGTVMERLTLRDQGGNTMINWSDANATSGEVIATTNASVDWSKTLSNVTDAGDIDIAWSFGAVADNATKTFTDMKGSVKISEDWVNNTKMAYTYNSTSGNAWETVAARGLNGSANYKDDFLFAGIISKGGDSYKGTSADFQMIVPTTYASTETYYFYVEL